uniref:IQ domain-containing protein N isoform X1 n=1 Tax=Panthera onca TaxID=9690 RepID=UPI0029548FC5|nr:IQ domain-containing protein N isoform X1 [Panthera onca]XP_060486617.1 IQ domain-containing protein N isoform X1 [Panthera onca]
MKAASSYKLASEIAPSPPAPSPTLWPFKAELTCSRRKTMQQATQLQLSPNGQSLYQPQSDPNLQDKARTLRPKPQHEPLGSKESLPQDLDKDKKVTRHIPRLRAVVESQAFKNILVDEMDMMLSRAATLIQANWRGYRLRQKLISQMMAAKAIQEAWRHFNTKRLLRSGKSVEKKVRVEEGDIPYHPPQQVRFQHPGESKSPLAQPIMVSKETQFPSSDSLAACTHQLVLLQTQSSPQPGIRVPCTIGGPSVTFLPHQTIAIRLPCPVNLDAKCRPRLLTRTVRNSCLVHVEGDTVKTKQVTARANKSGAPGPPPPARCAPAVHGSLKTQTQDHMEAEVFRAPPQTGPAAVITKTPPQPCVVPTGTVAKAPPQMYPAARMTKTPLQSCLAAMMNKTPPQPCSTPTATITKTPPQMYQVGPVAKASPQTCPVAAVAKTSPQTSQPATVTKTPLQSCLAAMVNKTPPQPSPAAPVSKTPTQMRATASITNPSPQTRPAAMMAKISPQICLLASMIKPPTQTRPVAAMTKTPPQTCPVPAMAKTPPQTRLAAMVTKTPAQFRSVAAIIRTLCLPPPTAGNLKSSPPAAAAAGVPNTSSHTYLNGPKAKAVVDAKQTTGMVKISSRSSLPEGKVKYFPPPHLGAGTPKAPARPPLEAEKIKTFSQKQVKTETVSNTSLAVETPRASPWAKVTEDRNKSSLQTHLRTDVMKVQSQVYVPVETAVVLPRGEPAPCPAKAAGTCLAKALPQERLATCSTTASSQGQLLAELTATLPQAHLGTCLSKTLPQAHPSSKLTKALSQGHPPAELTTAEAQSHLGPCPSKALSQARPSAKLTKTPSFAHLGTCLTKAQSQAHLATGAVKVQSQAHLPTGLAKVHSQAQLVTEAAKCLYATHQPAELSSKTQSQPLLAGFKASSQPCHHVGALGTLPRAKPEDRLTQMQPHSHAQGKATRGPCQGSSETQSMLMPLLASARHPTCNIESWGDSGATRAQPSMAGPATPCQEELAASQLASLCAELAAELGSQEDLRALLAKALSQGQVRAALNQALTKKVLGATMTKALPQGMLGTALMKVLSWGELGIALSRTLTPTELRAKLAKAKQGKLAGMLSKALTEEEWAALSQALCQGELGAVLSQSLSQAALRTGVVLPKATSQAAGSRMTVMPTPMEVGSPSAAWGPTLGPVRPQPSKVRVPQDGAWEGFFTGRPAGFLAEMGDGAMLGGSPCSSVVSMGASLTSRVITTVHQYPLIAALDPTPSREMGPSRDSSSNLYLTPEVSEENVCLPPAAGELSSDLNPVESDTGPDLPRPPLLLLPPSLWQPLIANGVGPSTSQPSVAGGTAQSSHKPHVSRVAPHPWASSREGRVAPAMPPCTVGGGKASHSHRCVAAYGGSVCWCRPSGVNKVPPVVYRSSATKVPRQPSVVREDAVQKTQSSNHKRASPDPRERIGNATSGPRRAAAVSKATLAQPQTPKACDMSLGLLPGSAAPGHRWALKTQVDPSVFQASPGSRLAHPLPGTAIPRQERKRTEGTISSGHCPREQVTGRILNELVASLPQGLDNDLSGSLSPDSTDCGPNVSNSQSSLPSCSSLSLSTMSVASLTAIDLVGEESLVASLDRDIRGDALLSGEAEGGPQGPGDRGETREVSWPHTTPNLHHPPSASSEPMPILYHSSVSGHVTLGVHWGSDDPDERDVSSGQSSMDLKKSLSQKSYRTGLTRSVSLGDVAPTVYQQPSVASRLTSSLSLPSVADTMAPNPQQPFIVSRVTPSLSESSMTTKVTPSLAQPSVTGGVAPNMDQASVASRVTPNLVQPSVTGGVAPNIDQASVTGKVAPSLAQPSGTSGVASNLAQASVTSSVAPSLAQPSVTGGVAPNLAQPSITGRVAPSLAQPSMTGGVAPSLSEASVTGRVAPSLAQPSVTSEVAPNLAQPSVTGGSAPNLAQASVTGNMAPSLAQPSITSGVALNLAQPSVTGAMAPKLAQPSMTGRVAPILAQLSVTSGTAPNLAQASVISVVAPSLAQSSVTSVVAPNLAWPSLTSVVAPNLAQASMTGVVAPSLAQPSVTGGVALSLAQPPVTSGVAPNLAQPSMTGRVVPRLAQPSVTSGVAPNLAQASVISGVAPSLAQPSVTSGVSPNLAQPSMTSAMAPNLAWSSVTSMVAPNLAQASLTSGVAPSLAQPPVTSVVTSSLAQPSMTSVMAPSLAQPSVTSGMAPNLMQASVTSRVVPSLTQLPVTGGMAPSLAQPSVTSGVAPNLAQPPVTSVVTSSLAQPSVTSGMAPNLMQASVTSRVVPSLTQLPVTGGVAPSLAQPSVTRGVAPSLAQAPVASREPFSLFQPSIMSGTSCAIGQSSRPPKVGSNLPSSRVNAVAPSRRHPSVVTEVPPSASYPSGTSSTGQGLSQPSVTPGVDPCQDPVMVSGVASHPQAPEFSEVSLEFHQPLSVRGRCPSRTAHSAVALSAPNLYQVPVAGGEDPCLDQGTGISLGALFRGMATSMSPGAMAAGMFPNMSRGTLAAGMFLRVSPGPVCPGTAGSVCQRSAVTGGGPDQFQVASGMTPTASPGSVAGVPLVREQASEVGPGFSQASVPNRWGRSPFKFSQASVAPNMSPVNVDLPTPLNHQHPSVSTIVAPGYQQANAVSQEPVMGTDSGLVPGSVANTMATAMAPGAVASGVAPSLPPGSVIRGVGQSLPPGPVVSDVPPHLPPGYVVSGVAQTLPPGCVIYGISHSLPPGSVIRGMGQGLPPDPMASAVAQSFPLGSVASGMTRTLCPGSVAPSLIAASGAGGMRQSLPVRCAVSFTAPSLVPGSVASEVAPNVSPESVASIVVPASMAGGLNRGLVLGSRASAAGLPPTVGNVAQSLPQGSMLIGITPRPYYGSLAGEGSIAPFQASRAIGLAQLHPRAGEASGTTRRVHQRPPVLQRASQLSHAPGMMPFETTDDQVMLKPEDLEKALSQASESSGESIVLEETPWMSHSLPSTDINHSLQFLPNGQKPLLEEVAPSETKSLTSGMAPVPPQSLSIAQHWRAGGVTAALQQGSATTWGAPNSHFVTTSRVPSVHVESVRAPLAHQRATAAHGSQGPSVALIVPQNPFADHVPQSHAHEAGASTIVAGSPKLAHGSIITSSLHPGSVAGMGTPRTSQRSVAARVASHVPLYPPRVSGAASGGFQTEAVPRPHEKPASGDPLQTSHKFLGSRKSYRSMPGSLVSEMLDDNVARIVPSRDVREQAHRSSRQSPEHLPATPAAVTPVMRTEATHDMGIPGLHPEFQRVSLGYESSPGGSRRPLLTQEPTWGSRDFQSTVAPTDSPGALLTPAVLQGPADAVRAGGQARNPAVPSGAVGPVDRAVTPGGPWELPRASVPGDTVGREAAVNPRQPGKPMASMQAVEKIIIHALVVIQACTRGYLARRTIKAWHQWAVVIQAAWRGYRVRRDLAQLSRAATIIQAVWRGFCIRRGQTPPALLQGVWAEMGGRTGSTSDHRCFQSCQPHVCPLCQSLSPRAGSPPSVVMLVGSSPRTCHMCGHTLPTRVVHGMGRGARVQAGVPWGSGTLTTPGSPRQSRRQNKAAATIQSAWRGFSARRQLRQQQVAAKTLQATWRGHHTRATLTTDALLGPAAWDDPQYMQWPGV